MKSLLHELSSLIKCLWMTLLAERLFGKMRSFEIPGG